MRDIKLTQAKSSLMVHKPYFGMMSSYLNVLFSENQESFLSDGDSLYINPDFFDELTPKEREFVLSNAAMHRLLDHEQRKNSKMKWLWQLSTDYAINSMLVSNGMTLPNRVSYDKRFDGKYAEEIYDILKAEIMNENYEDDEDLDSGLNEQNKRKENQQKPQEEKSQEPKDKDANRYEMEGDLEQSLIEAQHDEALQKAQSFGEVPLDIQRLISHKATSTLSWRDILAEFIEVNLHGDFVMFPSNKKYMHMGILLPSYQPSKQKLAIVVDTSASISEELLDQFIAEIESIRLDVEDLEIELFLVDAKIQDHETFIYGQPLEIDIIGGGGTKFEPAFEYIEDEALAVACLLYFTDGAGSFPDEEPDYPVMWVMSKDHPVPFGEKILITVSDND